MNLSISLFQRHAHSTTTKGLLVRHLCLHNTSGKLRNFLRMVSASYYSGPKVTLKDMSQLTVKHNPC